ncbi:MAG: LPS export ABC transporter permease LptG [Nitrococcus mobilis]|nr:LPS export ABC transporter permease LptG [Nitrococcus mobilis]
MKLIDRYIARNVTAGALIVLLVIVSLDLLFSFLKESQDSGQGGYTVWLALLYVLLTTPYSAYQAFPFATLIGSLIGLGGLAARSELVVMRGTGMSALTIARPLVVAGLSLALVAMGIGEWLAPRTDRLATELQTRAIGGRLSAGGESGFWARDGDRYVHARQVPEADVLEDLQIYAFQGVRLDQIITAWRAHYEQGVWVLRAPVTTDFAADGSVHVSRAASARYRSELKPDMLDVVVVEPEVLPITQLWTYARYLEQNGLDSSRYRLAFWVKVATPLATVTMLLLTVPLVFGSLRSANMGQRIFIGVLIGIAFFLLNRLLNRAAMVFGLPPLASALGPTVLFLAIALGSLVRLSRRSV